MSNVSVDILEYSAISRKRCISTFTVDSVDDGVCHVWVLVAMVLVWDASVYLIITHVLHHNIFEIDLTSFGIFLIGKVHIVRWLIVSSCWSIRRMWFWWCVFGNILWIWVFISRLFIGWGKFSWLVLGWTSIILRHYDVRCSWISAYR